MQFKYSISVALLCLVGCSGAQNQMQFDLDRLNRDLADLRSLQAEHTTLLASVRTDIRELRGRIEQVEYNQSQLSSLKGDLSVLKQRVPPPTIVPAEELEADEQLADQLGGANGASFKSALGKIRDGNFQQAASELQALAGLSSGENWGANVLFWVGVTQDGLANPKEALRAYHECATTYPKHPRVPMALLRQATSFMRLNDSATAKLTYKKLIAEYPTSKEASVAKQRLQER